MKSLEDLRKLRDSARQMLHLREGGENIQIVIGMGTCGIAAGARDTLAAIMQELRQLNILNVVITQTGCAGLCEKEPLIDIVLPGESRVTYGKVDAEKARQIIAEHVVKKRVIDKWVVER